MRLISVVGRLNAGQIPPGVNAGVRGLPRSRSVRMFP